MHGFGVINSGLVTLEFVAILVRCHDAPAVFGDHVPFDYSFALVQVEPGVFEAKIAKDFVMKGSHRRALEEKMLLLGAKEVFYWRFKEGEPPYKVRITKGNSERISA